MWIILGVIGSAIMAVLELSAVTDIGYWWSLLPTGIGILMQLGLAELLHIFD